MRTKKNDIYTLAKKEIRKVEKPGRIRLISANTNSNGSVPKRYQSVFDNDTPLTSFGVQNDHNHHRKHSPPTHIQPQIHQRSNKSVKEFLTAHPPNNQQVNDYRRATSSHTNGLTRSQIEATVQNVNVALTQTFNKLRQEPSHPIPRYTPTQNEPSRDRPVTARLTTYQNTGTTTSSDYYYDTKGSLPVELITKRPTSTILPNNTTHNRCSTGVAPLVVQRLTTPRPIIRTNDNTHVHSSTPLRVLVKSPEIVLDQFHFGKVTSDEHLRNLRVDNNPQTIKSRKQSSNVDYQYQALPEVSVNPQIQSIVRPNPDPYLSPYQPTLNGDIYTNHHHIQVEPTHTIRRTSPRIKSEQPIDVKPNPIVQHQRANSPAEKPFDAAYIERGNTRAQGLPKPNTPIPHYNNSTSTVKQESIQNLPPSPLTTELNYKRRKKQRTKNSIRANTGALVNRKNIKYHRPSSRLENYDNVSDSELTLTETPSRDTDTATRPNHRLPSDILSDVWSDLTNEFNDIKLHKNHKVRTSTPNVTQRSSSLSSKDIGHMRKQIHNLQIMYNDLLKVYENETESIKSSLKSPTSSQFERHGRRHRSRKVVSIVPKPHQSNSTMREINQRFSRLESSIVTLAESVAKLSAQVQIQRVTKEDVYQLRLEVAELRQQLSHQQSSISVTRRASSMSRISPQTSHLITADVQHLAAVHSTNPINISTTSYLPSPSLMNPRQARKIEQFFGTEVMLRYFLSLLSYDVYASILEQEKIGFYELPFIDERKLQSFGIPYGPCVRMIYESQQYFISLLTFKSHGVHV